MIVYKIEVKVNMTLTSINMLLLKKIMTGVIMLHVIYEKKLILNVKKEGEK